MVAPQVIIREEIIMPAPENKGQTRLEETEKWLRSKKTKRGDKLQLEEQKVSGSGITNIVREVEKL